MCSRVQTVLFSYWTDCGDTVTAPHNGNVTYDTGTTFSSVAQFKCDKGYNLTGDGNTVCLGDGNWQDYNVSCTIIGKIFTFLHGIESVCRHNNSF